MSRKNNHFGESGFSRRWNPNDFEDYSFDDDHNDDDISDEDYDEIDPDLIDDEHRTRINKLTEKIQASPKIAESLSWFDSRDVFQSRNSKTPGYAPLHLIMKHSTQKVLAFLSHWSYLWCKRNDENPVTEFYCTTEKIREKTLECRRSVFYALKELKDKGYITTEVNKFQGKRTIRINFRKIIQDMEDAFQKMVKRPPKSE